MALSWTSQPQKREVGDPNVPVAPEVSDAQRRLENELSHAHFCAWVGPEVASVFSCHSNSFLYESRVMLLAGGFTVLSGCESSSMAVAVFDLQRREVCLQRPSQ